MIESTGLIGIFLLLAGGWYWFDAIRAKELPPPPGAGAAVMRVTFLDDTVALARLRLCRAASGHLSICRQYRFEFASDGGVRYAGEIAMRGRVSRVWKWSRTGRPMSKNVVAAQAPQHFLYFFPLPQGQGSLRPILGPVLRTVPGVMTLPST